MEEDGAGSRDPLVGARQDSDMSFAGASEIEAEESLLSVELRETLATLGLGDLSAAVRQRVLLHVGNDVARAVDWIMENGDQVTEWMSSSEVDSETSPTILPTGTNIMTHDGKRGRISSVRADGSYDLELSGHSPRLSVSREQLFVDPNSPPDEPLDHLEHVTHQLDQMDFGHLEDDRDEDEGPEHPGDSDLGRLLSHLREFSEIAALVSLQPGQAGSARVGAAAAAAAAAANSPVFRRGDRVLLAGEQHGRHPDMQRGPLRHGQVGEVIQVGEAHVNVRTDEGERTWWYARNALAPAPAEDTASPASPSSSLHCAASFSHAAACAHIRSPLKDAEETKVAVKRMVAGGFTSLLDLLRQCEEGGLLDALADGLEQCGVASRGASLHAASGEVESVVEALLQLLERLARKLFSGLEQNRTDVIGVGELVRFKPDKAEQAVDGLVIDDLGFGNFCVLASKGREAFKLERSRLTKKSARGEVRPVEGVVGYLNELLVSRAVPLGDIGIVQRVLADGASIEHRDGDGNTPLIIAVEKGGSMDLINVLIQNGARVEAQNMGGKTALVAAAESGKVEVVRRLLEEGADAEKVDLTKCNDEVRLVIEQSQGCNGGSTGRNGLSKRLTELQGKFVRRLLPLLVQQHAWSPVPLSSDSERRLVTVALTALEKIGADSSCAASVKAGDLIDRKSLAEPVFAIAQEMVANPVALDVLLGLRMVHALLRVDASLSAELKRYNVQHLLPRLVGRAHLPWAGPTPSAGEGLLSGMMAPRAVYPEASWKGVAMLAEELAQNLQGQPTNELWSPSSLAMRIAGGDVTALEELRELVLQPGKVTAKELVRDGLLEALLSFLQPGDAQRSRERQMALRWVLLGQDSACPCPDGQVAGADVSVRTTVRPQTFGESKREMAAVQILVRHLQNVVASYEALPTSHAGLGASGSTGLRQLLEPHRVKLLHLPATDKGPTTIAGLDALADPTEDAVAPAKDKGVNYDAMTVLVEPLAPVSSLTLHVLRTSAVKDANYQHFCRQLVGRTVYDRPCRDGEEPGPYRRALVLSYRAVEPSQIGVHRLRYQAEGAREAGVGPGEDVEAVMAVRDYKVSTERAVPAEELDKALQAVGEEGDAGDDKEDERVHMVLITYPHEAVPMDLFMDSVMGAVLQALRQPDPGQSPFGKQSGEEYDFPSRGFPEGQSEFQEALTRGLSEAPHLAPVARGQTRREAQVLLARLNGICEASLRIERGRNYMPRLQQGPGLARGSRVQSKHGRDDNAIGTILFQAEGGDKCGLVYDDGVFVEGVPSSAVRDLAKRRSRPPGGRQLVFAFGRIHAHGAADDDDLANPAALSRSFESFLLKGKDSVPNRYDFTEPDQPDAVAQSSDVGLPDKGWREPPSLQLTYAIDPSGGSSSSANASWNPVALSSRHRTLYALSNDGATAYKSDRDTFVDSLRANEPLTSGVHRFRLRIDETSGEDFCNHVGFIAGDNYRVSALNSTDSCCVEVDSARLSVDGRSTGCTISRRPAAGDVIVLEVDLERGEFTAGIEGEGSTTVQWGSLRRPVYLAISFRRVGWRVTLVAPGGQEAGTAVDKAESLRSTVQSSLEELDGDMTMIQGMQRLLANASKATQDKSPPAAPAAEKSSPAVRESAGSLAAGQPAHKLCELLMQVQVEGADPAEWACLDGGRGRPAGRKGVVQEWTQSGGGERERAAAEQQLRAGEAGEAGVPVGTWQSLHALHRELALERDEQVRGLQQGNVLVSPGLLRTSTGKRLSELLAEVGLGPEACRAMSLLSSLDEIMSHDAVGGFGQDGLVNRQLTRKLSMLLDDALTIASSCLPKWCHVIPPLFPFLFGFPDREQLVKCTAFGISHTMYWLQEQRVDPALRDDLRHAEQAMGHVTEMAGDRAQRAYDGLLRAEEAIDGQRIGRLRSDIARVQRGESILQQAERLMRQHARMTRKLEVQFVGEHGFGWGVTQGFYTAVALEMQRADDAVQCWRPTGLEAPGEVHEHYLQVGSEGLFLRPLARGDVSVGKVCERMQFLGRLMAKALRDGFSVPLPLSRAFFSLVRGDRLGRQDLPPLGSTGGIVRGMALVLEQLEAVSAQRLPPDECRARVREVGHLPCTLLAPDYLGPAMTVEEYVVAAEGEWPAFVDPAGLVRDPQSGEPLELAPGGAKRRLALDEALLREWVDAVVKLWLNDGVKQQIEAFRNGVDEVFPVQTLLRFTSSELQRMLCGHQQVVWTAYISDDWLKRGQARLEDERKALEEHIQPIGRLSKSSAVLTLLIDELVAMDNSRRQKFLELVTANPRLPAGGLPQAGIKVAPRAQARIWAQTCAKTLYLPDYASAEELRSGLDEAFANAALGGFHECTVPLGEPAPRLSTTTEAAAAAAVEAALAEALSPSSPAPAGGSVPVSDE